MTIARSKLVDVSVTRYYHCVSRCVRKAFLMGPGYEHRLQWIEKRLEFLAKWFSISVGSFAVMDNHLHVMVRLDPEDAKDWSAREVARRWLNLHPPRGLDLEDAESVELWIEKIANNKILIVVYRKRLGSLSWFMKALKEPLARMANKEDECSGAFWESRFKSIAILDDIALLFGTMYIEMNSVAAGKSKTPEESDYTSIRQRIEHVKRKGLIQSLASSENYNALSENTKPNVEQDHWLIPIEDRRMVPGCPKNTREGLLESVSLRSYLLLIDHASRIFRKGKARVDTGVASILDRIGANIESWENRLKKMLGAKRFRGNYFTTDYQKLRELAKRQGNRYLVNLIPKPSR